MVPFLKTTSDLVTKTTAADEENLARLHMQYLSAANDDKYYSTYYAEETARAAGE